ncbi:MAG: hypothetical protein DRQ10_01040 [Candidatus Hydrothermota bacterium]|nr:MAG: hypothetical protein DRQ10_01040 [Candidatus Hydrothermae bacterium]
MLLSQIALVITLAYNGRVFSSFSLLKDIEVASFLVEKNYQNWNWSFSSFSKNDHFLARKVRELTLKVSLNRPLRFGLLNLETEGQIDKDNLIEQRRIRLTANLNAKPKSWAKIEQSTSLEALKLLHDMSVKDNSGFEVAGRVTLGKPFASLDITGKAERRPILEKIKRGFSANFAYNPIGLEGYIRFEKADFSYELAGGTNHERHTVKEGAATWKRTHPFGSFNLSVNVSERSINFVREPLRDRLEQSLSFKNSLKFTDNAFIPIDFSFFMGLVKRKYPNAGVLEIDSTRGLEVLLDLQSMKLGYSIELQRTTFPSGGSADDNDEREIEFYVEGGDYLILRNLKTKIRMGVKQNDFVFIKSERSANTRQRKSFSLNVGFESDGKWTIRANYKLSAHYLRYKFAQDKDMLLRDFDVDVKVLRPFRHIETGLAVRLKYSDRGNISELVYHRQRVTKEYWIGPELLIKTNFGFNFKISSYGYFRKVYDRLDFVERSLSFSLLGDNVQVEYSLNRRNDLRFNTFTLEYKRGF